MYIKMLKAVSEMLEGDSLNDYKQWETQVRCAKLMLDKIIEGMDEGVPKILTKDRIANVQIPTTQPGQMIEVDKNLNPIPQKDTPPVKEVSLEVNDKRRIVKVHNATPTTVVELDGKKYSPTQVVGMTFTKGKIL